MQKRMCFGVMLFILAYAPLTSSNSMVIRFNDGSEVIYDTDTITSITFSSPNRSQVQSDQTLAFTAPIIAIRQQTFLDTMDNGLSSHWDPVAVVGGDFGKFAKFESGKLIVDVPADNSWGKTGIQSRQPIFTVDESFEQDPGIVLMKTDPALTTGFVVALAPSWHHDVWTTQNVWIHYVSATASEQGMVNFLNTQGLERYGANGLLPIQPEVAPEWIGLKVYPGRVALQLSGMNEPVELAMQWIQNGTPIYLQVFSHPKVESGPASIVVDSIMAGR